MGSKLNPWLSPCRIEKHNSPGFQYCSVPLRPHLLGSIARRTRHLGWTPLSRSLLPNFRAVYHVSASAAATKPLLPDSCCHTIGFRLSEESDYRKWRSSRSKKTGFRVQQVQTLGNAFQGRHLAKRSFQAPKRVLTPLTAIQRQLSSVTTVPYVISYFLLMLDPQTS
jgi:hypothetical protein